MKNYYEILEVNPKASKEIIDKAYKVLIKKYHPDAYSGEEKVKVEEKAKDINEAYKILSDQFLREQYDKELLREQEKTVLDNYTRIRKNNNKIVNKVETSNEKDMDNLNEVDKEEKARQVGSFGSIISIVRGIFKKRNLRDLKNLAREDYMAGGITIGIVIVLLIVLCAIPVTREWLKNMFIPFN